MIRRSAMQHSRRRGGSFILVLGTALAVTVIGLSALTAVRVQRVAAEGLTDAVQARFLAQSAIEVGLFRVADNAAWRTFYPNGYWVTDAPLGNGTYSLTGIDPLDGNLANNPRHAVVLTGIGMSGPAQYQLEVSLVADLPPLKALKTGLHASSEIHIRSGASLIVNGAPLSTNGNLNIEGLLIGSAQGASKSGAGTATGTIEVPSPAKTMPGSGVFDYYVALSTPVTFGGNVSKQVLAPGFNSIESTKTNADGVYYINAGSSNVSISKTRVHGTLIIKAATVTITDAVYFENYRPDYPVLIVQGNLNLGHESADTLMSEANADTNFNPAGAPYGGVTDNDKSDTYPNEVRGLVHVIGSLSMKNSARTRGVIIAEGTVSVDDAPEIIHNANIYKNRPVEYYEPPVMRVSAGSWRQVVD